MTTYHINGFEYDDADTAERQLSALFFDMCFDLDIDYGDDAAAWREFFNNWTDALNRDGDLCDAGYTDLCSVGAQFD
jgi:hypothetical protein